MTEQEIDEDIEAAKEALLTIIKNNPAAIIDINEKFWEGFDFAIELVINTIDNADIHTLPCDMIDLIIDEVDLYKKDC